MTSRKKTMAGVVVALAALGSGAHAAGWSDPQEGMYLAFSAGRADGSSETYDVGSSPSLGLGLGYRFNKHFATEVFWRSLSFELMPSWGSRSYEYPDTHLGVAAIGSLPLSDRLSLNARLGIGRTTMERSKDLRNSGHRNSVSAGVSLSYAVSRSFSLTFGYERYSKVDSGTANLGGEYRF